MDVVFGWLLVSTFLSKMIQVESYLEIKVGNFQLLRKHPRIRQCAEKVLLKQNVYVGARISDLTGVCEGLPHSWGRDPTIGSGYGYAKISKKVWTIPGVLDKGAKLDMHITWGNTKNYLTITWNRGTHAEVDNYGGVMTDSRGDLHNLPHNFGPSVRYKFSFVAQGNTLRILVDDEVLLTKKMIHVRLNYVTKLVVASRVGDGQKPLIFLHRLEFSENNLEEDLLEEA